MKDIELFSYDKETTQDSPTREQNEILLVLKRCHIQRLLDGILSKQDDYSFLEKFLQRYNLYFSFFPNKFLHKQKT